MGAVWRAGQENVDEMRTPCENPDIKGLALAKALRIGILSDTHGRLPSGIARHLNGLDVILHAGDIDAPGVLRVLGRAAPVVAVRGNMDLGQWAGGLPEADTFELAGVLFHLRHDASRLDLDPVAAGIAVVVSGHTHVPRLKRNESVLYLNPGSASNPRNGSEAGMMRVWIENRRITCRRIAFDDEPA